MRFLQSISILLLLTAADYSIPRPAEAAERKKILVVLSSEGREKGTTRSGFEMDELSQAYLIFKKNGFHIDIASPKGGHAEADAYDAKAPFNADFIADVEAMKTLQNTQRTDAVGSGNYAAVYIVGGKGAMFDLPQDQALGKLIREIYERGGVVGAVCHGPAALVNVTLSNGQPLIKDKMVTGFTNEEETVFGKKWKQEFSFLLEDAIIGKGARWKEAPLMMSNVVADGRLVTGQNPYSTPGVAEAMVSAAGQTPVQRVAWRDELTMQLMESALQPEKHDFIRHQLNTDTKKYHIELVGLVGYYQLQVADNDDEIRTALVFMELAFPHMTAPQLKLGMAVANQKLGNLSRARDLVKMVMEQHPDMPEAKKLWQTLTTEKQ